MKRKFLTIRLAVIGILGVHEISGLYIHNVKMMSNSLEDIKPSQFKLLIGKKSKYVYILKEFDSTLRDMREEGVLDLIMNNYQ